MLLSNGTQSTRIRHENFWVYVIPYVVELYVVSDVVELLFVRDCSSQILDPNEINKTPNLFNWINPLTTTI